jgi:hypothetical protein
MSRNYRRMVVEQTTANYLKVLVVILAAFLAVGLGILTTYMR